MPAVDIVSASIRDTHATYFMELQRFEDAEQALLQAEQQLERQLGADDPHSRSPMEHLVDLFQRRNQEASRLA